MSPLGWITLFIVISLIPLPSALLRSAFTLRLMQGNPAEPRGIRFVRIICSSLLFGGVLGLTLGWVAIAVRLLLPYLFSK